MIRRARIDSGRQLDIVGSPPSPIRGPTPHSTLALVSLFISLSIFTSLSFFSYGVSCLVSRWMRAEFERYGLPRYRVLTGSLEIVGALGLLVGLRMPVIGLTAAVGLTLLMAGAVAVRIRIRDSVLQTLPAVAYFALTVSLIIGFARLP